VSWIGGATKNVTNIVITHGHGDHFFGAGPATVIRVAELDTVCAGDAVYNNIHMWLWNIHLVLICALPVWLMHEYSLRIAP
jgi:metal-dependent hydrolase (beta-lactamase superfamily II)